MLPVTLGLIRHLLTFLGGFMVTNGMVGQNEADALVGAGATIIGIAWSALAKNKNFPNIK